MSEEKVYELVDVPTEYRRAIRTPKGEIISVDDAVVEILNLVKEIRSGLGEN
jgi:hypothetical protein